MIKMGIIGVGFIGRAHIEAVRRLGFVEVAAMSGSDGEAARAKAKEFQIPLVYENYKDMLSDASIAVVHNCTPNHLHYVISKDIILSGKHVLSEKPLAMTIEESEELARLAQEHEVIHAVNFNYRQYALVQQLKHMIRSEELGRPNLVRGYYLQDWLSEETDFNWRLLPKFGGRSRAVADVGSHWIDLAQYVLQDRIVEVFADLGPVIPVRKRNVSNRVTVGVDSDKDGADEDVVVETEDYAHVIMRFQSGVRGAFMVSQVSPGHKNHLRLEIDGSRASAAWDQENPNYLWIGHRRRANEIMMSDPEVMALEVKPFARYPGGHHEGWPDAMTNAMRNFYEQVLKTPTRDTSDWNFAAFSDGHRTMCVIDAILESNARGRWVSVPS